MSLAQIEKLLTDSSIGVDAWYECYLDDVVDLFKPLIATNQLDACFDLLSKLSNEQKIKFFEAITEIQDVALVPKLFNILETADQALAEPIIDGLRCWELAGDDLEMLKKYSQTFYGKSKVLDSILDTFLKIEEALNNSITILRGLLIPKSQTMKNFNQIIISEQIIPLTTTIFSSLLIGFDKYEHPKYMIRRFDHEISANYIPLWVSLNQAIAQWIRQRPTINKVIKFDEFVEIGTDYVIKPYLFGGPMLNILYKKKGAGLDYIKEDIAKIEQILKSEINAPKDSKTAFIENTLLKCITEHSSKSYYNDNIEQLIIIEPSFSKELLDQWASFD